MTQPKKETATYMAETRPKKALGRGIGALISGVEPQGKDASSYFQCEVGQLSPNPFQPRITFTQGELEELAESIREQGVLQPLLVRKKGLGFELITGERRLRAAKLAGMKKVPVVVQEISDEKALEFAIIENVQRQGLNPLEEADAYYRLMTEFDLTQEDVAQRVGKSRPAVANLLRLRALPELIRHSLLNGSLSAGHARAILGAETKPKQIAIWKEVMGKNLSVRQTEELVKRRENGKEPSKTASKEIKDPQLERVLHELSLQLGTKVTLRRKGGKGHLEIEFYSDEDLTRLIDALQLP
jgi:ParB family chromosome partitioning protein